VLFHTDAVQTPGKIKIDVKALGVDFLSLSAHKLHAPKGIGMLYVRRQVHYQPYLIGGHQERGRRGGTENVASIIGCGRAAELARANLPDENTRIRAMRNRLEEGLLSTIPNAMRNGAKEPRLPNTTNISFDWVEAEAVLMLLDQVGICASSGSACTTGSVDPSPVLIAMGLDPMRARGSLRFSLGIYNDEKDVDYVLMHLPKIIAHLRTNSPLAPGPAQNGKLHDDTNGVMSAPIIIESTSGDVVPSTVTA
jgi:cysteine desulfurase